MRRHASATGTGALARTELERQVERRSSRLVPGPQ